MSKTIKTFTSLLGGYAYRVTSDGETVSYQERTPNSARFVTRATESKARFDQLAEENGLFDPYQGDNPAIISNRIRELTQW